MEHPEIPHMTATPSETIRRQIHVTFQNDPAGVAAAEKLELLDNLMWSSDYPTVAPPGPNRGKPSRARWAICRTRWREGSPWETLPNSITS